ncbi:MAG: hypothetical protein BGO98_05155 [Myxococcales bacterium 68-20]|nr:hypothetical protein [Myxococcales bacterium]OJY28467.1 MAG: hypothetical protein BGO98_05155 [Myxococcales bacterium 68-20]
MPKITVGTFNTENLFLRYRLLDKERGSRFGKKVDKKQFEEGGGSILMLGVRLEEFGPISKAARKLTAKVIVENDPDILALQEVENLEALKLFNGYFLKRRYPYSIARARCGQRGASVSAGASTTSYASTGSWPQPARARAGPWGACMRSTK